jgi:hypothetical protein
MKSDSISVFQEEMEMKRLAILWVLAALIIGSSAANATVGYIGTATPQTGKPGDTITLKITLYNNQSSPALVGKVQYYVYSGTYSEYIVLNENLTIPANGSWNGTGSFKIPNKSNLTWLGGISYVYATIDTNNNVGDYIVREEFTTVKVTLPKTSDGKSKGFIPGFEMAVIIGGILLALEIRRRR